MGDGQKCISGDLALPVDLGHLGRFRTEFPNAPCALACANIMIANADHSNNSSIVEYMQEVSKVLLERIAMGELHMEVIGSGAREAPGAHGGRPLGHVVTALRGERGKERDTRARPLHRCWAVPQGYSVRAGVRVLRVRTGFKASVAGPTHWS